MTKSTPRTSFVGRESELHQLQRALEVTMKAGLPKFVFIQGDSGVGKTALVEHFLAGIRNQYPAVLIGQAKCAMETEGNGLLPFSQLLTSLIEASAAQAQPLGDMDELLASVAPAWQDVLMAGTGRKEASGRTKGEQGIADAIALSRSADLANRSGGVDVSAESVQVSGDVVGRDKIIASITNIYERSREQYTPAQVYVQFGNVLRRIAEQQVLVVFIDDLQWTDASSLRLWFHLAQNLGNGAILFLAAYRPVQALETGTHAELFREIRTEMMEHHSADEIEIQEGILVKDYVAARYPINSFPESLIQQVQEKTDGHPLFVSELFTLWENNLKIRLQGESPSQQSWQLADAVLPEIPKKLTEVLRQLIRLMGEELEDVLRVASVEGEDFTAQVIARVKQLEERRTFQALATIRKQYRLIRELKKQDDDVGTTLGTVLNSYRFVHRFFRKHVYDELEDGDREGLHREIGKCLEELYRDDVQIVAGQLARHFREAHQPVRAARYALLAAQVEQSRYAWAESERWCEFGLTAISKLTVNAEIRQLRLDQLQLSGYGFEKTGQYERADQQYRGALELARQLAVNPLRVANLCAQMVEVSDGLGHPLEKSEELVNFGRQVLATPGIETSEAHIALECAWGYVLARAGKREAATECLRSAVQQSETLPRTANLLAIQSRAYDIISWNQSTTNYRASVAASEKAIKLAQDSASRNSEARCWLNLAFAHILHRKFAEGASANAEGYKLASQTGNQDLIAFARHNSGIILLDQGDPKAAQDEINGAIALAQSLKAWWNMPAMYADLALTDLALGDLTAAYDHAQTGLSHSLHNTSLFQRAYATQTLARVETTRQEMASATELFQQAIALFQQDGDRLSAAHAQQYFAEMLRQQAKSQQAIEILRAALITFQEQSLDSDVVETQRLLDNIAASQ